MTFYVECTHTCHTELNAGIQRVVRNLVKHSVEARQRPVQPVMFEGNRFVPAPLLLLDPPKAGPDSRSGGAVRRAIKQALRPLIDYGRNVFRTFRLFLAALLPFPPLVRFLTAPHTQYGLSGLLKRPLMALRRKRGSSADLGIAVQPGDVLVLADASWHLDIWPAIAAFKRQGGLVVWLVYDLIPKTHPQFCENAFVDIFTQWADRLMTEADVIIGISRATAEKVRKALPASVAERMPPPRISHFWLGSELDGLDPENRKIRPAVQALAGEDEPFYLYVSTIEPRKNHGYALDAFDMLWRRGIKARMVIAGRVGWRCDALLERVRRHPCFGERLQMFNDLTDDELALLYRHARGLLFTSFVEGFGLPIVEALQHGLPVFASDIPVFHEIGKEGVSFVDLGDPASLAEAISRHLARGAPRLPAPVPWLSWRDSAEQFWQRLEDCLASEPDRRLQLVNRARA